MKTPSGKKSLQTKLVNKANEDISEDDDNFAKDSDVDPLEGLYSACENKIEETKYTDDDLKMGEKIEMCMTR